MGDCVGTLAYGLTISKKKYDQIYNVLYEERPAMWNGKLLGYNSYHEKDEKSSVTLDQPYETEDYLVIIRDSRQSAFNGVDKVNVEVKPEWDLQLSDFCATYGIKTKDKPSWLLAGHYN